MSAQFIETVSGEQINLDHVVRIRRGRKIGDDDTIFMADGEIIRCRLYNTTSDVVALTDTVVPASATDEAIVSFDYGGFQGDGERVGFSRMKIVAWSVHTVGGGADPIFTDDVIGTSNATVGVIQPDGSVTRVPSGSGITWSSIDMFKEEMLQQAAALAKGGAA